MLDQVKGLRQKAAWKLFSEGTPFLSHAYYRQLEPILFRRALKNSTSGYDPIGYSFHGGEFEKLTANNYEKALRNIWKAEIQAPYLGIRDASKLEKAGAEVNDEHRETVELMSVATSDMVRKEFEDAFSPEQRQAIGHILSLIGHGEAYAMFTSSKLVSVVQGTGARLGMAMQVMEEAKHFVVLREMLRTLGIDQPLKPCAYLLFERIANADPYTMLFGMNTVLESFATSVFAQFADYPGLRHIVHVFHMDEARHVGFPKTYAQNGGLPGWVTTSRKAQRKRLQLLLPAIPLIFEYKPYFEAIGLDNFSFWGKFLAKSVRVADDAGFEMPFTPEEFLSQINLLFNSYVTAFEPEKFDEYRDYTKLHRNEYREDIMARELQVFGPKVFGVAN